MAMVGVVSGSLYRKTHSLSRLVWSWVGGRLAPFYIHQMNRVNSRNGCAMITGPLNVVLDIIIILLLGHSFCWISGTFFFVGAVNNAARLPWHLWTRNGQFFIGCIWGVRINGGDVEDLPRFAADQQVRGVEPGCKTKALACAHPQCSQGVCEDRTSAEGFICVCTNTSYSGKLCSEGLLASKFIITKVDGSRGVGSAFSSVC